MSTGFALAIVAVQVLSGATWWLWLGRGSSLPEVLGMGLALGTFASMVSAIALPSVSFAWAIPSIVTLIAAIIDRRRLRAALKRTQVGRWQLVALAIGAFAGLLVLTANWLRTPLDAVSDRSYADIYFFESLSRGLASFGPGESILMVGGNLQYHWFTYAWAGELAQSAGLPAFAALTRLLPLTAMVGLVLLALAWTDLFEVRNQPRWVPSLAVLLVVFAGYTGALYGSILNFDSPSQSLTTVWLMALGIAFLRYLKSGFFPVAILAALLTAATVGGKVSHAAVGLAGMVLASLLGGILRTPWWKRAVAVTLLSVLCAAATYLLVLSGAAIEGNLTKDLAVKASTWQGLDPLIGRWGVPAGTAALILAVLARPAGLAWLLRKGAGWRDPAALFTLGGLVVGIGAFFVFREGVNETWFILAASGVGAAAAAVGAGQAMSWAQRRGISRPLRRAALIAIPASIASLVLSLNWPVEDSVWPPSTGIISVSGLLHWSAVVSAWIIVGLGAIWVARVARPGIRWKAWFAFSITAIMLTSIGTRPAAIWTSGREIQTDTGVVQPAAAVAPTTSADLAQRQQAAQWLSLRAATGDIVATSDPASAFIPAQTGLRMFLAGERYQSGLGDVGDAAEVKRRSALARQIGNGPSQTVLADLCMVGVRWVWIEGDIGAWSADYQEDGIGIVDLAPLCA